MKTICPELQSAIKKLSLGKILDALPQRISLAEKDDMPIEDFLLMVFVDEIERRRGAASARRADQAGLDPSMVMERWDKTAKVTFDRRVLQELCTLRFVAAHRNVVVLGPVGVGKTFLASALGHLACHASFRVRLLRADALLRMMRQSRLDNSRDALMTELCTIDLLIIDDFALEPMSREESRDVYQLFIERNARASTIVTSNRDTSDWLAVFDDALLAQSAVDRFKNNAYDLVVDGESYRDRLKPNVDNDGPPPAAPVTRPPPARRRTPAGDLAQTSEPPGPFGGLRGPRLDRDIVAKIASVVGPSPGPMIVAIGGPIRVASGTDEVAARRRHGDGELRVAQEGAPQGGGISPLMSNIYLHYVFDLWVQQWRKRHARGEVYVVRYADDVVLGFQHERDALAMRSAMAERLAKFGLELHPDKTRVLQFGRFARKDSERNGRVRPETFDFLGFTHIAGVSREGKFQLQRRTSRKKRAAKLSVLRRTIRQRMHEPPGEQHRWLCSVIRGHCNYYGVPTNYRALRSFRHVVEQAWHRQLQRRSQRARWTVDKTKRFEARYPLPAPHIVHPWPAQRFAGP
jgi:DNA replication protein DnaC